MEKTKFEFCASCQAELTTSEIAHAQEQCFGCIEANIEHPRGDHRNFSHGACSGCNKEIAALKAKIVELEALLKSREVSLAELEEKITQQQMDFSKGLYTPEHETQRRYFKAKCIEFETKTTVQAKLIEKYEKALKNIRERCFDDSVWGRYIDKVFRAESGVGEGEGE